MNNLITRIENQLTRDIAYAYSKDKGIKEDKFIFSMVYDFSKNLPYSMDIQQEEYVPADFLNMTPYDFADSKFFKWEDSRTIYKAMTSWGDTFKSGIVLQICAIFQKMLLGQFPNDYVLGEDDFYLWGIDKMTSKEDYNKKFFETLKSLPDYYKRIQETKSIEERRKVLDEIYAEMQDIILNKVGGFRQTDSEGNTVREIEPTIILKPVSDLEMLYNFKYVEYSREISKLKEMIKKQDLIKLRSSQKETFIEVDDKEK